MRVLCGVSLCSAWDSLYKGGKVKLTNSQAIEVQQALINLLGSKDIPVRCGMEIATLSVAIDKQVTAFKKVRDNLISNYQIKLENLDKGGAVKFTTSLKGDDDESTKQIAQEALKEFSDKINELVELEGEDIKHKFHIPDDINIQPSILKPLLGFVDFNNAD
jgi:hypothetical protein